MTAPIATPSPAPTRAGRNLPAAILVGCSLGALVLVSLFIRKEAFLVVLVAALALAVWELRGGIEHGHVRAPLLPALVGAVAMPVAAYLRGGQALIACFGLAVMAMLLWRLVDGRTDAVRDVSGGVFVSGYVSFLGSFAALMLAEPDGPQRVFVFILLTVCSDVGGYAVGVLAGRHPMAPSISPKKSWEGTCGSALACVLGGVIGIPLALGGPWWAGVVAGLAVVLAATVGDLSESTIKRDLGIKDMGSILPGHGGIMDRLDSLLLVAPVVWAVLAAFVRPS
ncbi:MAG TPA: phosphatidate cytidylyltransferase [Dermatophilaceae bacterium]|nr:phosphatidate cytidylyltransferase [Dermatophilaceae bacterium]